MLSYINIKNVVLIDNLELDFAEGFTSLTGETGAGKSIVLTALGLLIGKKADANILRFGSEYAEVVGEFKTNPKITAILNDNEIESDELVIRRKITADGKSKSFINDTPVSLKLLSQIGENLVEIHGQHDQSSLLDTSEQREIIDRFASLEKSLQNLSAKYAEWKAALAELDDRKRKILDAKKEEDYLRHVLDELTELNPQIGEEAELADKRRAMMDGEKIAKIIRDVTEELTRDKNVDYAIVSAQKSLARSGRPEFNQIIEHLEKASMELGEAFSALERAENDIDTSPERVSQIEERLFLIRELARKYDSPPDQLSDLKDEIEQKLSLLSNEEGDIKALTKKVSELEKEYKAIAVDISEKRKEAAKKLEKKLVAELKPLAMQGTKFEVKFTECEPSLKGIDKVEFMAATNPGLPVSPLADIASGGEISRFMLALKVVLLGVNAAPTVIFDEIDTGTGGAVAAAIGERLAKLGHEVQVFVVTHLPQVAALAATHMKVQKTASGKKNETTVKLLNANERKEELARMLAGSEITDEARAAAEKLMA